MLRVVPFPILGREDERVVGVELGDKLEVLEVVDESVELSLRFNECEVECLVRTGMMGTKSSAWAKVVLYTWSVCVYCMSCSPKEVDQHIGCVGHSCGGTMDAPYECYLEGADKIRVDVPWGLTHAKTNNF